MFDNTIAKDMSGSGSGSDSEWRSNGRPMSTIALSFSAALDDLFKLGSVGELKESVEQKNREVETQKSQLEDLDLRLKEADEQLKKLEMKHKRMSRNFSGRPSVQGLFDHDNAGSNSSDTDDQDALSPGSDGSEQSQ